MSGPPPGYNENASALPGGGGDAPIMKVMGGGGMPDGYTNASLLAGGEGATITRVMGGGGDTEIAAAEEAFNAAVTALAAAPADPILIAKKKNAEAILELEKRKKPIEEEIKKEETAKREAEDKKKNLEGQKEVHTQSLSRLASAKKEAKESSVAAEVSDVAERTVAPTRIRHIIELIDINIAAQNAIITAHDAKIKKLRAQLVDLDAQLAALRPDIPAPLPAPVPIPVPTPTPGPTPATKNFQVEIYQIKLPDDLTETLKSEVQKFNPTNDNRFPTLVTNFIDRSIIKSKRYMTSTSESNPQVPNKDGNGLADKIVHFINPKTTDTVIIAPPMKGNIQKFLTYMEYLSMNDIIDDNEKIIPGKVLIFMAPFFANNMEQDIKLLFSALYFQDKNPESIYILQETDLSSSIEIGKSFYTRVPGLINPAKNYLLNYLNPSYVILPGQAGTYPGLIFSSHDKLVKAKGTNFKSVEEMIGLKKLGFSFNSNAGTNESFNSYLTFLSNGEKSAFPIHTSSDKKCNSLITLFYDHEIKANPFILPDNDKIIFLRFGYKELPLICSDLLTGELHEHIPGPDPFNGNENNVGFEKAEILTVEIDGIIREFRIPTYQYIVDNNGNRRREQINKVVANWEAGIYSDKEAEFLNDLNLSPQILTVLVGPGRIWKKDVADFFFNLVDSKCFTDEDIITRAPCDDTREFLNKIYNYFYDHTLNRIEDKKQGFKLRELHIPGVTVINWPIELTLEGVDGQLPPDGDHSGFSHDGKTNFRDVLVVDRKSANYQYMKLVTEKPKSTAESFRRNLKLIEEALNILNTSITPDEKNKPNYISTLGNLNEYIKCINILIAAVDLTNTVEGGQEALNSTLHDIENAKATFDNSISEINRSELSSETYKKAWTTVKNKSELYDYIKNETLLDELIAEFRHIYPEFIFVPL